MSASSVSIVIRAYNEEKYLPRLLKAIHAQTYADYEVILVDSGSTDLTREIAKPHVHRLIQIDSRDFTFGYSLNVGIAAGSGRFVVMVSAHTEPMDPGWLAALVAPLRDERTAMVYGRQLGAEESKFPERQDLLRTFGEVPRLLEPPNFFANNANSAVRRDLWEQHPFDETLPGLEDIEWAKYWMERGYGVAYEPRAAIFHIHDESWRQIRRRYHREGMAARWVGIKGRRHIPTEILREVRYFAADLASVARGHASQAKVAQIGRFRFEKAVGTCRGLWDSAVVGDPRRRQEVFFDTKCRAVTIHGVGRAVLEEVEVPPVKPGDVLVKVAYEAVCATDLEILDGVLGYYKSGLARYPIVPGHEFSGRVMKLGANANHIREGDKVVVECIQACGECEQCRKGNWTSCTNRRELGVIGLNGGYSEYVVVSARFVHAVPDTVDMRAATLCEPLAVVLKGLRRLERAWGPGGIKQCAVVGAGPLGHLCARVLALRGHKVVAFDRDPVRLSYLAGSGIETSAELHHLEGFDALIEATGDPLALHEMLQDSGGGATLLLLGLPYANREFNFESIVAFDKTIVGSVGSGPEDFEEAIRLLPSLDISSYLHQIVPVESFSRAFELARSHRYLKVLIEIDGNLASIAQEETVARG